MYVVYALPIRTERLQYDLNWSPRGYVRHSDSYSPNGPEVLLDERVGHGVQILQSELMEPTCCGISP